VMRGFGQRPKCGGPGRPLRRGSNRVGLKQHGKIRAVRGKVTASTYLHQGGAGNDEVGTSSNVRFLFGGPRLEQLFGHSTLLFLSCFFSVL
jgi:hypothetical protein